MRAIGVDDPLNVKYDVLLSGGLLPPLIAAVDREEESDVFDEAGDETTVMVEPTAEAIVKDVVAADTAEDDEDALAEQLLFELKMFVTFGAAVVAEDVFADPMWPPPPP